MTQFLRRLSTGTYHNFYKEGYSLLCLRERCSRMENKDVRLTAFYFQKSNFKRRKRRYWCRLFPKPLVTTPKQETESAEDEQWERARGGRTRSVGPKTGSIQAACSATEKIPKRIVLGAHQGSTQEDPMPQGARRCKAECRIQRPCQVERSVSSSTCPLRTGHVRIRWAPITGHWSYGSPGILTLSWVSGNSRKEWYQSFPVAQQNKAQIKN